MATVRRSFRVSVGFKVAVAALLVLLADVLFFGHDLGSSVGVFALAWLTGDSEELRLVHAALGGALTGGLLATVTALGAVFLAAALAGAFATGLRVAALTLAVLAAAEDLPAFAALEAGAFTTGLLWMAYLARIERNARFVHLCGDSARGLHRQRRCYTPLPCDKCPG